MTAVHHQPIFRLARSSRSGRILAFLLALVGLLALASTPAAAQDPPPEVPADGGTSFGFTVRPYAEEGSQPRSALEYEVEPGQAVADRIAVINGSDKPKTFYLYAADAYNTSGTGGFALRLRTEERSDAGGWITLPAPKVTIPGHQAALVPVQVTVPADAEPGDHAAGIVAEEIVKQPKTTKPGAGVSYVHRVGTRVYVRVAGPVHPKLQISTIKVASTTPMLPGVTGHGGATVTYTVRNSGNVRLTVKQIELQVDGMLGRNLKTVVTDRKKKGSGLADDLLPGNSISLQAKLSSLPPIGQITAKVSAQAEDPVVHTKLHVSRSTSFWVIPWLLLLILLVLVVALVLLRRRRRRRRLAAADGAGGGAPGPDDGRPDDAGPDGAESSDAEPEPVGAG